MSNEIDQYKQAHQFSQVSPNDDEIDLRELFSVIWKGKWLIIAITFVFAVGAVVFAINQPNIYKSEALLSPADSEQAGGELAALAGQFGGLASMAGINLGGGGGVDKTQMAIEVMKSRQFVSEFIQKHDILADLMAAEKWDMQNNTLSYDNESYDSANKQWVRDAKPPFKPEPSMQEAFKVFSKIIAVNSAKETGMVNVSIQHISPYIAQQWVLWLVEDINLTMKSRDVEEAKRSVNFLEKQIEETNLADIKSILYSLIEEQTKTIMFAEVRDEYVFKTIDPAIVAEERFKPKRAIMILIGSMIGFCIGIFIVLVSYFIRVVKFR